MRYKDHVRLTFAETSGDPPLQTFMTLSVPRHIVVRALAIDSMPDMTGIWKTSYVPNVWANGDGVEVAVRRVPKRVDVVDRQVPE